jgi:predicted MPP superfamily phosphohydrolase
VAKLTRRQFLKRALVAGVGLTALDALIEPEWIATRRVVARVSGLGEGLAGYRIGLLSDIHYPRNISSGYVQRACRTLVEAGIDTAIVPGDLVDGKSITKVPSFKGLYDALGEAKGGAYTVLGNHDHWLDADGTRKELALSTPLRLIENEHVLIERYGAVLALGGVGDLWEGTVDVTKAFRGVDPGVPRMLLSHNPDFAEDCRDDVRIDLQISGHTHGGEVAMPWGWAPHIPSKYGNKFRYGFSQGRSHRCFTTAGICSPRHVRLFCRPEVVVIELQPAR